jgi:hypothetical protein
MVGENKTVVNVVADISFGRIMRESDSMPREGSIVAIQLTKKTVTPIFNTRVVDVLDDLAKRDYGTPFTSLERS